MLSKCTGRQGANFPPHDAAIIKEVMENVDEIEVAEFATQ